MACTARSSLRCVPTRIAYIQAVACCHMPVAVACTCMPFLRGGERDCDAGWVCGFGPSRQVGPGRWTRSGARFLAMPVASERQAGACGCGMRGPDFSGPGQAWRCCHRAGLTRVAARPVWSCLHGWGPWGRGRMQEPAHGPRRRVLRYRRIRVEVVDWWSCRASLET